MAKMNVTSLDALTDEVFGPNGTPKRDAMEKQLKEEVNACSGGGATREVRPVQTPSQTAPGERKHPSSPHQ